MTTAGSGEDWLGEARRRLLVQPQPGGWLAVIVRAIEPSGDDTPPHFLVAAWAPSASGLFERVPEFAAIASPDGDRALRELFVHLPREARVALVGDDIVDCALVAEMVLVCDPNLEPYQRAGLARFAAHRRRTMRWEIARRFTPREPDFERFRARALGGAGGNPHADDGGAGAGGRPHSDGEGAGGADHPGSGGEGAAGAAPHEAPPPG
jgi:hypothetical protein